MSRKARGFAILGIILISGCSRGSSLPNLVPVRGSVMYDGQPVAHGLVTFDPVDPQSGQPATGHIQNGSFKMLTSVTAPGVIEGKYNVRIESREDVVPDEHPELRKPYAPEVPPSLIPIKYSDFTTSGFVVDVEAGMAPVQFDLEDE